MTKQPGQRQRHIDSDKLLRKLASGLPGVICTCWLSADGLSHRCLFISDQIEQILGISPGELRESAEAIFSRFIRMTSSA